MAHAERAPAHSFRSWLSRPVRDAFRHQQFMTLVMLLPMASAILLARGRPVIWLPAVGVMLLLTLRDFVRDRIGRRLAAATWDFRTVEGRRVVLHHAPELDPFQTALFLRTCEDELEGLERRFGTRLRAWWLRTGRVRVYLFERGEQAGGVYGFSADGFADWVRWSVTLGADADWRELLRHELAHLFAGRWSLTAPRVLVEGLAVWAQRTTRGRPIDSLAARRLPQSGDPVAMLLDPQWPDDPRELYGRYYVLAGSFTGFLVRRYGLGVFRRFYRTTWTRKTDFARRFERYFGDPLPTVGREWVAHLRRQPAWTASPDGSL